MKAKGKIEIWLEAMAENDNVNFEPSVQMIAGGTQPHRTPLGSPFPATPSRLVRWTLCRIRVQSASEPDSFTRFTACQQSSHPEPNGPGPGEAGVADALPCPAMRPPFLTVMIEHADKT